MSRRMTVEEGVLTCIAEISKRDARIAALEEQLAETERSADHWLGEARRLLKAGQNAAYSLEATPPAPKVTEDGQ